MTQSTSNVAGRLLPIPRAAAYLAISPRTLRSLIERGALPVVRVSARRVALDQRDLDLYIEQQRTNA